VIGRLDPWRGCFDPPQCCGPVAAGPRSDVRGELVSFDDPPPDIGALLEWIGMAGHVTMRSAAGPVAAATAMAAWTCQVSLHDRPGIPMAWALGAAIGVPTIAPTPPPAPGTGPNPCAVAEVTRITRAGTVRVGIDPVAATRRAAQLLRSPAEQAHAARATLAAAPDHQSARSRWFAALEQLAATDA
jgi:hypothetical protein